MKLLFSRRRNGHTCSFEPIEAKRIWIEYRPNSEKTGFDVFRITQNQAKCPVCKSQIALKDKTETQTGFKTNLEITGGK